ncbi:DUF2642 domain-containing protein [Metabacillus malikii]|uniref:DUF2642 domain-containing protein n=1 Tax=Metabacillus malikii TaxID=1504265 RepID=A0ABT9ZKT3_9BACI|nr:DUF2642 domain-containing protein [Metabacillus malikii]MDQ0232504.1 hypothetical protein [Metabacillus malikii]
MAIRFSFRNENRAALLRRLVDLTNALSDNSSSSFNLSANLGNLLDFDVNVEVSCGDDNGDTPTPPPVDPTPTPVLPETLYGLLRTLLNERVQVTTAFDTLTGTLIGVQDDYISLIESTGNLVFVLYDQIESVVEL